MGILTEEDGADEDRCEDAEADHTCDVVKPPPSMRKHWTMEYCWVASCIHLRAVVFILLGFILWLGKYNSKIQLTVNLCLELFATSWNIKKIPTYTPVSMR